MCVGTNSADAQPIQRALPTTGFGTHASATRATRASQHKRTHSLTHSHSHSLRLTLFHTHRQTQVVPCSLVTDDTHMRGTWQSVTIAVNAIQVTENGSPSREQYVLKTPSSVRQ